MRLIDEREKAETKFRAQLHGQELTENSRGTLGQSARSLHERMKQRRRR